MSEKNRSVETFCEVPIFTYDGWDPVEEGHLCFYNVMWNIEAMKKYNGRCVDRMLNGMIAVYSENGGIEFTCYPCDFAEVRAIILRRELIL